MGDVMCVGIVLISGLAIAVPPPAAGTGSPTTAVAQVATVPAGQPSPVVTGPPPAETTPTPPPSTQTGPAIPAVPTATAPTTVPGPAQIRVVEPVHPAKSRYLVQVMEGVLQSAVRYAAGQMAVKLRAVSPDLLQLSGAARARGFRLDGYGVFFDVEVPAALRQTMGWTARMMQQNDQQMDQALLQLRRAMSELDGKRRMDAETALKLVELRARPILPRENAYGPMMVERNASAAVQASSTQGPNVGDAATPTSSTPAAPNAPASDAASRAVDLAWMQNPDTAYEMEVREALIGAMLGYGNTLALQPDEWLTVAAHDNQSVVVPGDLTETVTVILRIKGSDLAELMSGRLSEQDARRRVDVREF